MTDREAFYESVLAFFDSGVIKEVYGNEQICILNIANSLYMGTNYYKGKGNGNYMGLILDMDQVRLAVENNEYISAFMKNASKKVLKQVIIEFNEKTLEIAKGIKERTDREGPSEYIDFAFEEELAGLAREGV